MTKTPKPTFKLGEFALVDGIPEGEAYELVVELPRLPDGDGHSLSVILHRDEEGKCTLSIEHEMRGSTSCLGYFEIVPEEFGRLLAAEIARCPEDLP